MKAMSVTMAAAMLLGLAACGDDTAGPLTLTDGAFVVSRIGEAKMQKPAPTIQFRADGKFNGIASCNSYGGSYTADGSRLTLSGMFSTKIACTPALMAQEQALFAALGSGAAYRLTGDGIVIEGTQRIEAERVLVRQQ